MKNYLACLVAVSMSVALVGCKKSDEQKVDDAASDAADSITSGMDAAAEKVSDTAKQVSKVLEDQTVEAGCAGCSYKMKEADGCQLAIKVAGKPYIVTGVDVDAHEEGLCDAVKQASIAGSIEDGKAALTKFKIQ